MFGQLTCGQVCCDPGCLRREHQLSTMKPGLGFAILVKVRQSPPKSESPFQPCSRAGIEEKNERESSRGGCAMPVVTLTMLRSENIQNPPQAIATSRPTPALTPSTILTLFPSSSPITLTHPCLTAASNPTIPAQPRHTAANFLLYAFS